MNINLPRLALQVVPADCLLPVAGERARRRAGGLLRSGAEETGHTGATGLPQGGLPGLGHGVSQRDLHLTDHYLMTNTPVSKLVPGLGQWCSAMGPKPLRPLLYDHTVYYILMIAGGPEPRHAGLRHGVTVSNGTCTKYFMTIQQHSLPWDTFNFAMGSLGLQLYSQHANYCRSRHGASGLLCLKGQGMTSEMVFHKGTCIS